MAKKPPIAPDKYTGLILAECETCGEITTFFSEEEVKTFSCRKCRKVQTLVPPASNLIATCECGKRIRGVTNASNAIIHFNCKCGYPIDAEYSDRKNTFYGMR